MAPALLAVTAAALAGTIWLELRGGLPDSGAMPLPQPVLPATAAAQPAAAEMSASAAQWAAAVLARPLFNPGRRPVAPPELGAAPPAAVPRVSGVIVTGPQRYAIFARDGRKPAVLQVGGQIDGYMVQSIEAGRVIVAGPGGLMELRPSFDRKANAAAGESPPATPQAARADASAAPAAGPTIEALRNLPEVQRLLTLPVLPTPATFPTVSTPPAR